MRRAAPKVGAVALCCLLIGSLLAALPATGGPAAAQAGPPPIRVNLNGPALVVDGNPFTAEAATPGLAVTGRRHCSTTAPNPATSAEATALLRCFRWHNGTGNVSATFSGLPPGDRDVYVWVFEDNASQRFTLRIGGTAVAAVVSGAAGTWQRLGPFRTSTTGTIRIDTSGGDANLSAVEVLPTTGTPPPTTTTTTTTVPTTSTTVPTTTTTAPTTTTTTPGNPPPAGGWTPADFTDEGVIGGLTRALSADWLPDGRMLVLGKNGHVYVADPRQGTKSLHFEIPNVDATGERGALDILVDPAFASNRRFYVYYSVSPSTRLRIVRYTLSTNGAQDLAGGTVVWENPGPAHSQFGEFHIGGSLDIGADGNFYLTVGDGLQPSNAQDLTNVFGKILRIGPDGRPASGNPFADGAGPNIDEIWAYGLRNSFRTSFDRPTGRYFVGDVGGNNASTAYEEINLGRAGANYGWPRCEGPLTGPKNGANCPPGIDGPILWYPHAAADGCCQNASVTAGEVFRSRALPAGLDGAFIFGDYAERDIRYATFSSPTAVATHGILKALPNSQPVWISQGPDGHIYFVHFSYSGSTGEIRRLRFNGTVQRPPVIDTSTVSATAGPPSLAVTFTGRATDPNGDAVSYLWDFGDGQTSTSPTVTHTYTTAGTYTARLRVTAGGDTVFGDPATIRVGRPPVADITSPADGSPFRAGETITVTGSASDDAPLPADAMAWEVLFVHDEHSHPVAAGGGSQIRIPIATTGHGYEGDTGYRVTLAVTDRDGLRTTDVINLRPRKVPVDLRTNLPAGAAVSVDGIRQQFPFTIDTIEGFQHRIDAPASVCQAGREWRLGQWTGGRAPAFDVTVPAAPLTLTATYADTGSAGACSAGDQLRVSSSSDRRNPVPLEGWRVPASGSTYIFLDATQPFVRVRFHLDDPQRTRAPFRTENAAPWDFAGGGDLASPYNVRGLAAGPHTITAVGTRAEGTEVVVNATLTR